MQTIIYEGIVTALSSIMHNGGERNGTTTQLRREKFVQTNGKPVSVPVISGNSIRGILRDKGMLYMLHQLGYGANLETGEVKGLPLGAFYFLFSGGSLTSTGESGVNVDRFRRMKELIPLIGIFGGAAGNAIMPGKLKVGKLIPICRETIHLLPPAVAPDHLFSVWDMCQVEMYTRRDDEKNDRLRGVLDPADYRTTAKLAAPAAAPAPEPAQGGLFDPEYSGVETLEANVAPVATPAKKEPAEPKPQQMMYQAETLAAGTRFFWNVELEDATPVEQEAFFSALLTFSQSPYIGGRSAVGHGKISVEFKNWMEINPRMNFNGQAVDFKMGERYTQFLAERKDEICDLLNAMK